MDFFIIKENDENIFEKKVNDFLFYLDMIDFEPSYFKIEHDVFCFRAFIGAKRIRLNQITYNLRSWNKEKIRKEKPEVIEKFNRINDWVVKELKKKGLIEG